MAVRRLDDAALHRATGADAQAGVVRGLQPRQRQLWFLPKASENEAAVDGWFPYALPAGRYSLEVRQTSGDGSLISIDALDVAGVK